MPQSRDDTRHINSKNRIRRQKFAKTRLKKSNMAASSSAVLILLFTTLLLLLLPPTSESLVLLSPPGGGAPNHLGLTKREQWADYFSRNPLVRLYK